MDGFQECVREDLVTAILPGIIRYWTTGFGHSQRPAVKRCDKKRKLIGLGTSSAEYCTEYEHYLLGVWASLLFEEAEAVGVMLLPTACFGPVVAVLLE